MIGAVLDRTVREARGRIVAALASRFRDLDLAEDAFAEASLRAAGVWPAAGAPSDPAAWLYRVALRHGIDQVRRRQTRQRLAPEPPRAPPTAEDMLVEAQTGVPDERLSLIFTCCHPALATDARAALTLKVVCGLSTAEIAQAFLLPEATIAQRLVRAKRKIVAAGVPFGPPSAEARPERLAAVLMTLQVAFARVLQDGAGAGRHAALVGEMLSLTGVLAALAPQEPEALAFAALVRYAEARRPARCDAAGAMVPLSDQDPSLWDRALMEEGDRFYRAALAAGRPGPLTVQAAIHRAWRLRPDAASPPPWGRVLALYDALLELRDDEVVRLNRCVALGHVHGPAAALQELERLDPARLNGFAPFHAVRADLLMRLGRAAEAAVAYDRVLAAAPPPAERLWLVARLAAARAAAAAPARPVT